MREKPPAEPNPEKDPQLKQDMEFIRSLLESMGQLQILRWRTAEQRSSKSPEEVGKMEETVAEHLAGMSALFTAVFHKAEAEGDTAITSLNPLKVISMIHTHDIEEMITGDVTAKDKEHMVKEQQARKEVHASMQRLNFGSTLIEYANEYVTKETPEARFVKVIDELQAYLYIIYTRRFDMQNRDFENPETIPGLKYAQEFPTLQRTADILVRLLRNPQYITAEVPNFEQE